MLGLVFIFYLGKQFYDLAEKYKKPKWGYAAMGVLSYYLGSLILGLVIGIYIVLSNNPMSFGNYSDTTLGLLAIPFGLATSYGAYYLLKRYCQKSSYRESDFLDDDLLDQE